MGNSQCWTSVGGLSSSADRECGPGRILVALVKFFLLDVFLTENVLFDKVGNLARLVGCVLLCRDAKDCVELFEGWWTEGWEREV